MWTIPSTTPAGSAPRDALPAPRAKNLCFVGKCGMMVTSLIFIPRKGGRALDSTRQRILSATYQAVRRYGLDGVRIQNISELALLSQGALYRYFPGKDDLMIAAFTEIDKQAAAIFEQVDIDPAVIQTDPAAAIKGLWLPYFRFWAQRGDETVFYYRFRDSALFPSYDKSRDVSYFSRFLDMVESFFSAYPDLRRIDPDLLWLHILTGTVMYAKCVVEGVLPNTPETEDAIFRLLFTGLSGYLHNPAEN